MLALVQYLLKITIKKFGNKIGIDFFQKKIPLAELHDAIRLRSRVDTGFKTCSMPAPSGLLDLRGV